MLCRDCIASPYRDITCRREDFFGDSELCGVMDYSEVIYTRLHLHDIFAGRYYFTFSATYLAEHYGEGEYFYVYVDTALVAWASYCRDQYTKLFNELIKSPQIECLTKVQKLYELLDQYSKSHYDVNYFWLGSMPNYYWGFWDTYGKQVRGLWKKYGSKVWAELKKEQEAVMPVSAAPHQYSELEHSIDDDYEENFLKIWQKAKRV